MTADETGARGDQDARGLGAESRELTHQSARERTCRQCGMLLDDIAEFHPYVFCLLKRAGRDPWREIVGVAESLGLGPLPPKPPLVRDLNRQGRDDG